MKIEFDSCYLSLKLSSLGSSKINVSRAPLARGCVPSFSFRAADHFPPADVWIPDQNALFKHPNRNCKPVRRDDIF